MEITHLGGETTVTGSCHLVRTHGLNILIDCGLAQGNDHLPPLESWPLSVSEIDYLFCTHAHVDHIGRIPELIRAGFRGEILCSHPTKALLLPMLEDTMSLTGINHDKIRGLAKQIDERSWGFEYGESFRLRKGVGFSLGRAGHILGSCFVRLETGEQTLVFSGDLGQRQTPILPDPDPLPACDLLVMESTYGDRLHPDRTRRRARLAQVLEQSLADGGKVFVPVFALGRAQEILFELDRLWEDGDWRRRLSPPADEAVPVFVDSPLGLRVTEVFDAMRPFWDAEAKGLLARGDHPFDFERLYAVKRHREHRELLDFDGPAIILAGSGMCSGGRIVDHLAAGLDDPKNDVVFVGYQAHGTLGRRIEKYGRRPGGYVFVDGRRVDIRAGIHILAGYSAHADQNGLLDWLATAPERPQKIKLVHGEDHARTTLASVLQTRGYKVTMPA